jgi:hypothetical protein
MPRKLRIRPDYFGAPDNRYRSSDLRQEHWKASGQIGNESVVSVLIRYSICVDAGLRKCPTVTVAWRRTSAVFVTSLCLLAFGSNLAAQPSTPTTPIEIDGTPCRDCTVTARRALSIGGTDTPLIGNPVRIARDGRGRIYVLDQMIRDEPPQVYDSSGAFLGRVGGVGKGPGEVTPVMFMEVIHGDTIRVHSQGRVSIFAPDRRFVRSFTQRTPDMAPWDVVYLPGGGSASVSREVARRPEMTPIFVRDARGLLLRRIELSDNRGIQVMRRLAVARPRWKASLWVSETHQLKHEYLIMLMDTAGTVRTTYRRQPEWWHAKRSVGAMRFGPIDTIPRPVSSLTSLREDAHGRLHVLISHGRADWKGVRYTDRFNGHYETHLEIIDLASRRVIGDVVVPGAALQILSDDRFATYREDADGNPWLDIWAISVKVPVP